MRQLHHSSFSTSDVADPDYVNKKKQQDMMMDFAWTMGFKTGKGISCFLLLL